MAEATWLLIIWLTNCIGDGCPIESYDVYEQPSKADCEAARDVEMKRWSEKLKAVQGIQPRGVCIWGLLEDLEPGDE